jgi:hypothetical protein
LEGIFMLQSLRGLLVGAAVLLMAFVNDTLPQGKLSPAAITLASHSNQVLL